MQAAHTLTVMDPPTRKRRPQRAIWLALAIALLVHILLFLVPVFRSVEQPLSRTSKIQIQVQYENIQTSIETLPEAVTEQADMADVAPQPLESTVEAAASKQTPQNLAAQSMVEPLPIPASPPAQTIPDNDRPDKPKTAQQLTRTILGSQFITEPSVTDKIFGPQIPETNQSERKEFHFPLQTNMISMLDKPIPNLPFDYQKGLVHFAYEPGAKGELQRFWDKITPEFGWRTNYGTEVKCVWVLVIAACGWGRSKD